MPEKCVARKELAKEDVRKGCRRVRKVTDGPNFLRGEENAEHRASKKEKLQSVHRAINAAASTLLTEK